MSSDAANDKEQGQTNSLVVPKEKEEGGQDSPISVDMEEFDSFVNNNRPDTCAACLVKEDEARLLSNQLIEKENMNVTLIHSLKAKQAELES